MLSLDRIRQDSLQPNGIRAILFDLDGTLRQNRPASVQVFLDCAVRLGAEDSEERRLRATRWTHYYWAQSPELLADQQSFADEDLFWTNYASRHLLAFDCRQELAVQLAPQIHQYMKAEYKPEDSLMEEVPQTLQVLKAAGFRLGVLSNRTYPCLDYLETLGLQSYFDLALVAGEVACWKPEPDIFRHALDRLGLSSEQALYVGDNYYADIVGSQRAGLHPVLIDPEGIFPDAECPVIRKMGELPRILTEHSIHSKSA